MPPLIRNLTTGGYVNNTTTVKMAIRTGYTSNDILNWTNWTCVADSTITSASTIYSGSSEPTSTLGQDGDLYIQYTPAST